MNWQEAGSWVWYFCCLGSSRLEDIDIVFQSLLPSHTQTEFPWNYFPNIVVPKRHVWLCLCRILKWKSFFFVCIYLKFQVNAMPWWVVKIWTFFWKPKLSCVGWRARPLYWLRIVWTSKSEDPLEGISIEWNLSATWVRNAHHSSLIFALCRPCQHPSRTLGAQAVWPTQRCDDGIVHKRNPKTSQELRMLSSVTINCQVTKIVMNSDSQLSEL